MLHLIWTILIGFVVGVLARFLAGGGPSGFIITSLIGIGGSLAATYLGHAVGWYKAGETAGFIGAVVGAILLLVLYHFLIRQGVV